MNFSIIYMLSPYSLDVYLIQRLVMKGKTKMGPNKKVMIKVKLKSNLNYTKFKWSKHA